MCVDQLQLRPFTSTVTMVCLVFCGDKMWEVSPAISRAKMTLQVPQPGFPTHLKTRRNTSFPPCFCLRLSCTWFFLLLLSSQPRQSFYSLQCQWSYHTNTMRRSGSLSRLGITRPCELRNSQQSPWAMCEHDCFVPSTELGRRHTQVISDTDMESISTPIPDGD